MDSVDRKQGAAYSGRGMDPTPHHLGWDRPFSGSVAGWLREHGETGGGLDRMLVWVPSSRAGRHVLSELFGHRQEREALHPPRLVTPGRFVESLCGDRAASEAVAWHAWTTVLTDAPPSGWEVLFPARELRGASWASAMAPQLMDLQARLREANESLQSVARLPDLPDAGRWEALALLESSWLAELERRGLLSPEAALAEVLTEGIPVGEWDRVVVAGVLDLTPRQVRVLEAFLERDVPVDLLVPVPGDWAASLDNWGRPLPGDWKTAPLPDARLHPILHRASDPRQLIEWILELASGYGESVDALVVGTPEAEWETLLVETSRLAGQPFYSPRGRPLSRTSWGRLLLLYADWRQSGSLRDFQEWTLHSFARRWMEAVGLDVAVLETALLEVRTQRLLSHFSQLGDKALEPDAALVAVRRAVRAVQALEDARSGAPSFAEGLWEWLQAVAEVFPEGPPDPAVLRSLESLLREVLEAHPPTGPGGSAESWELLRFLMDRRAHYPERGARQRPVCGWLELPWETAPHVVVLGLADEQVPGPSPTDPFLSPALSRRIGLPDADQSVALEAARLRILLESRGGQGRVDLLLPERDLADSPALPSRILFQADPDSLLQRVGLLADTGASSAGETPPAEFGGTLALPEPVPPDHLAVTDFSAYLSNPFAFFLQRLRGWEAPEPLPAEMDARVFGSLAHEVMDCLNGSEEGCRLEEANELADFLEERLEAALARRFGSRRSVPLEIQAGSLRERLRAAADIISRERRSGWRPVRSEWAWHRESVFRIAGMNLHGKVDLLERLEGEEKYRVVDYKTSDTPSPARGAHLSKVRSNSADPPLPECDFEEEGTVYRWSNLQLPLYALAVWEVLGHEADCGYFNLCRATTEIGLDLWTPTPVEREAARACAAAVVAAVREGRFPARPTRWRDPWETWLGAGGAAVEPAWKTRYMEARG